MESLSIVTLLSQKLYQLRKERNITLQEVHLQTGIAVSSLSAYEKGKYVPSLDSICKIAKFYQVSLDFLLDVFEYK